MTRAIAILVLLCPALASASPAYPFDELLRRSETVFTCELTARTSPVEFKVTKTLRGKPPSAVKFDFDPNVQGDLPKGITRYVVISQGDDHFGKPTSHASLGQGIEGQVSYRGWIVFPVQANGEVTGALVFVKDKMVTVKLDQVAAIVRRSPYKPVR